MDVKVPTRILFFLGTSSRANKYPTADLPAPQSPKKKIIDLLKSIFFENINAMCKIH